MQRDVGDLYHLTGGVDLLIEGNCLVEEEEDESGGKEHVTEVGSGSVGVHGDYHEEARKKSEQRVHDVVGGGDGEERQTLQRKGTGEISRALPEFEPQRLKGKAPAGNHMLPFGTSVVEFSVVTFISAFVGVALVIGSSRFVATRYLAAFALGIYVWYFSDTLGDANYLDVLQGPVYSTDLLAVLLLFAAGVVVFFAVDGGTFAPSDGVLRYGTALALVAALAVGLHGFGEGADFGFAAAQTSSNSLLAAFGGIQEGASWVLHKMFEPMMAAAVYVAFIPAGRKAGEKVVDALGLAAVFVAPAVAGSMVGYFTTTDNVYFFALGLGASVYVVARVARALYLGKPASGLSLKMALALILGFLCIYFAALLHS
jgi:hypothetical protein